jgi:hypothetical protein
MAKWFGGRFNGLEVNMTIKALPVAVALAAVALGLAPAIAQTSGGVEAKIPFEFTIGGKTLPPADYIIDVAGSTSPAVLMIRAKDGSVRVMFDTDQLPEKRDPQTVTLVFDDLGSKVYLMEVWGVVDSGRSVKHIVDGEIVKRAPEGSRRRIDAVRITPKQ